MIALYAPKNPVKWPFKYIYIQTNLQLPQEQEMCFTVGQSVRKKRENYGKVKMRNKNIDIKIIIGALI